MEYSFPKFFLKEVFMGFNEAAIFVSFLLLLYHWHIERARVLELGFRICTVYTLEYDKVGH